MSDLIQLLPDSIANQIAAGEVVQRPASALKELLENAVDAGATKVQVVVKEAGKQLIQVIDNGKGMTSTDAMMAFERHATSKIRTSEDLFSIRTFGFRGEALASIAAVAQVELKTKRADDELGTFIQIEGSEVKNQEPIATSQGTSVAMKNLFFNVPARRNFLKSNPVEMRHIVEEFQRVALSYSEISFSLRQNDMEIFQLHAGKLSQRIVGLFGKNYQSQLVPCEELTPHVNVKGYIGKPESAKKTRGEQFFFVNNRFIKSSYLNHAVSTAFEGLIQPDQHPFYVLFLEIDPSHIDINVHPTKTEIKFDDERTVYAVVRAAVKQALGAHHVVPALDFSVDVNFRDKWDQDPSNKSAVDREYSYKTFNTPELKKANPSGWEKLFEGVQRPIEIERKEEDTSSEILTFPSKANSEGEGKLLASEQLENTGTTFQVENNYIVAQMSTGLLIVDQQAAHERILYERYLRQLKLAQGPSQQSLFPPVVELSPGDFELVSGLMPELHSLGFMISVFGNQAVVIQGVPADIQVRNEKELFEGLIEQFKNFKNELSLETRENLARSLARKSSLKKGQKLNDQEMETLVGQLFACQNPNYGLSGNKTFVKLDLSSIHSFFGK
ncbi:MAG: DNA mismatch repair endonuclease MutL [Algoriphagus sp.]|uniref:DNA mismatch repair endonuclease MutL n=1 Tax=Algoriphagus sp. TaxID=1872435 RepID=UPI0017CF3F96|nr:DNA mismatch repair endonuclease MutL [Algoriphagus sp.]NVJ84932.1 DNA mismatch repair endonuclease MutL [Algoriphagus sp.]